MSTEIQIVEDVAVVQKIEGRKVTLRMEQNASCGACAMRGMCMGMDKVRIHETESDLALKPGDRVLVTISPGLRLLSSFMLFMVPVLLLILFFLGARYGLQLEEDPSILIGVLGLFVSGVVIWWFNRAFAHKLHFEISRRLEDDENSTQ